MKIGKWKRALSYVYPIVVEKRQGEVTSNLEVTLNQGKFELNTSGANYSYGGLHKVFEKAFSDAKMAGREINNSLILGFGAGSIASLLQEDLKLNTKITGVELDAEVIGLAKKYFDVERFETLTLHHANALNFVQSCNEKFDCIAIDLFVQTEVPSEFLQTSFLKNLHRLLSPSGILFFNVMIYSDNTQKTADELSNKMNKIFGNISFSKYYSMKSKNRVIICDRKKSGDRPQFKESYKTLSHWAKDLPEKKR